MYTSVTVLAQTAKPGVSQTKIICVCNKMRQLAAATQGLAQTATKSAADANEGEFCRTTRLLRPAKNLRFNKKRRFTTGE